jgi:TRAP-type C4-dicarboxylate transport system permease small subunit
LTSHGHGVKHIYSGLGSFNARLGRVELFLTTAFLALLVIANTVAVVGRMLFALYPTWIIEVSAGLLIASVFTGGGYLYKTRGHVAVTLLVDRLNKSSAIHRGVVIVGEALVLVFVGVALWQAAIYQPILWMRMTTALQIPQNFVSIFIPIAYVSIALSAIETLLGYWVKDR